MLSPLRLPTVTDVGTWRDVRLLYRHREVCHHADMNRFLARAIGTLNAVGAGVLLIVTLVLAVAVGNKSGSFGIGLLIAIVGFFLTLLLCGLIAMADDTRVTLH